ncbi:ADP-ribosylglycohydrolase family protein [Vibrio maritimus]|uniref:ADP-ribosylglycohydrolase family protein n=1 Tax=Vibrio maritimus TaxID=990268 RepID=UPI003736B7C3
MNSENNRALNSVIGALVADAASMGFHWLYDQVAIKTLSNGTPEFHAANEKDYIDKGYYAHHGKNPGDYSQYGAQLIAMLDAIARNGKYDEASYIRAFRDWFDLGGKWCGYIDKPTKLTILNIHALEAQEKPLHHVGADDTQNPALSKLPPLLAIHHSDKTLNDLVESAVRVTNNNDNAVDYALASAMMIKQAIAGKTPAECVKSAKGISEVSDTAIKAAEERILKPSNEVAQELGMHCGLEASLAVTAHLLLNATSYEASIRENILCGGDSCGRAILLGAVLAACYQGTDEDIPRDWELKVSLPKSLLACQRLLFI